MWISSLSLLPLPAVASHLTCHKSPQLHKIIHAPHSASCLCVWSPFLFLSFLSYFSIHGPSLLIFEYGTFVQAARAFAICHPCISYPCGSFTHWTQVTPQGWQVRFPSSSFTRPVTLSQPFLFFNFPLLTSIYLYIRYPSQSSKYHGFYPWPLEEDLEYIVTTPQYLWTENGIPPLKKLMLVMM